MLKRAIKTLYLVQEELDIHWIPVIRNWRLNERHYGDLQGLSKSETATKYGEAQVKVSTPCAVSENFTREGGCPDNAFLVRSNKKQVCFGLRV